MMTVWKYVLKTRMKQILSIPRAATTVHVGMQNGEVCIWVWLNPDSPMSNWVISVCDTGGVAPERQGFWPIYLGPVMDGSFVWHVFNEGPTDQSEKVITLAEGCKCGSLSGVENQRVVGGTLVRERVVCLKCGACLWDLKTGG